MSVALRSTSVCFVLSALSLIGIPPLTAQQVQFSTAHRNSEHVLSQSVTSTSSEILTTKLARRSGISVALADFDTDGTQDLVTGYATPGGGALLLQRGSPLADGQSVAPYRAHAEAIDLPVQPNFLKSADINGRGHADLLVAANGDTTVYLLKGHGNGTFAAPEAIALRGGITSLTTWRGASGETLLVAGVCSNNSCGLQFLAKDGTTKSYVPTGGPATSLETANLNHGRLLDIAAVVNGAGFLIMGDTVANVPRTESLPSNNAATLMTGSFVYDRRGFAQVAVLGADATLHIFARSGVDNTVPTMDEVRANRALDHARAARPASPQPSRLPWTEVETLPSVGPGGASPLMIRGRVTTGGSDDLLVFNGGQLVQVSHVAVKNGNTHRSLPLITNDSTPSPVTSAVAATVTPDVRQGLVTTQGGFQPHIAAPAPPNHSMTVNTTADATPNTTTINACRNGTAGCNLRSAIYVANSDASVTGNTTVDTINLPAGTYVLSANNGSAADGNGDKNIHFDLDGSVNIVGAGSGSTIIDANNQDNIFDMNSGVMNNLAPRSFFVTGVTLKNGLNSNSLTANPASFNYIGGLISWEAYGPGYLTMDDIVLTASKVMSGSGGAVGTSNSAPSAAGGVLELDNSTVSNNNTPEEGGGLYIGHDNPLVLTSVTVSGNNALTSVNSSDPANFGEGGGVETNGNTIGVTDTITNSTIRGNSATREGGGLDLINGFTMSGTKVTGNVGGQYGGGLVFESLNTAATVTTSTFTDNSATTDGAGICVQPDLNATSNTFTMHYSRIHGNTGTPHNGLAFGCQAAAGTATINATDNWWGCNGPASGTGCDVYGVTSGNTGTASTTLSPFTQLTLSVTSTSFPAGNTITATGSLDSDSDATVYSAANDVAYAGLPATLTIVQGASTTNSGSTTLSSTGSITTAATATQTGIANVTVDGFTVSADFTEATPPTVVTPPTIAHPFQLPTNDGNGSSPVTPQAGTGSLFLAVVEQLGTSSGRIDLYNLTLGATDTFSAASPASLAVTNSTNEGKPDVDNPRDLLFDGQGDLLLANGGQGGAVVAGSPDYGSFACVPAGAIATGSTSTTTNSSNARDPESIALGTDSSVAVGNVPASATYDMVEYLLGSIYLPAPTSRDISNPGGGNAVGTFNVAALPTSAANPAGTFAAAITNGTTISRVAIKRPDGSETDITDSTIVDPHAVGFDAQNNQLVIANFNTNASYLDFYSVGATPAKVKSILIRDDGAGNAQVEGDKLAVSPDGHVAVGGISSSGNPEVLVYDNTAARNLVGGPIPYDSTTTSCGSTYVYGQTVIVTGLRFLSNTKLLVTLRSSTASKQGVYIYDISQLASPGGFDGVTCTAAANSPKQTGFLNFSTNPPLGAAVRSTTPVYVDGTGNNCSGNSPCYTSINTAISSNPAGSLINILGGTFNESVTLNNNVVVNLDANTTVNDFTVSTGTLNLSGGNCGQANGATLTLKTGDWVNNGGVFNPGSGTIAFTGSSVQHISGSPTSFYNLTNGNSAGLTLSSNTTVNGILAMTSSDIATGTNTLTQPSTAGTSTGTFDVVGSYQRTGSPLPNTALTYGNPNNVITLSGGAPTSLSVQLTKGMAPASLPKAVQRSYVITPAGSFTSASVQLHYLSGELNGNTETAIVITRFDSGQNRWVSQGAASRDTTNKWIQATGVTQFSTFTFVSPPSISSINSNQGRTAGGDNVTINGSYFTSAGGVTIGGNALTTVSVVSDTQITGTTPAGTIGAASVIVTAAGGSNAANSLFTYIGPPTATNGAPVNTTVNTAVNVTLTATDPNNPAESLSYSYAQPAHGSVTGSGPTVTYTPAPGYFGSDSFTFSATNSFGLTSNTATESISIEGPPLVATGFTVSPVAAGTATTLFVTLTNPASNPATLNNLSFTDALPSGVAIYATGGTTTCTGGTVSATAHSASFSFSGGSLPAGSSCTVNVQVSGATEGSYTNSTSAVTSSNGGSGVAASALLVISSTRTIYVVSPTLTAGTSGYITANAVYQGSIPPSGTVTFVVPGISAANIGPVNCVYKVAHSNCTATISSVGVPLGTYTLTVTQAADSNYPAATETGFVTVH